MTRVILIRLAEWCRRVAARLDGTAACPVVTFDAAVMAQARAFVERADGFAPGTSGEYKRAWVYSRLRRTYPPMAKTMANLLVELALQSVRRSQGIDVITAA